MPVAKVVQRFYPVLAFLGGFAWDALTIGRRVRATDFWQLGAYLFGTEGAEANGLIDDTMGRDEAFRHFAEAAGLDPDNTRVVAPQPPSPWAQLLGVDPG